MAVMTARALRGVGWMHRAFVSHRRADVLADTLAPILASHARVVDIGCGNGRLARLLGERLPQSRIVGTDVLPSRAEVAYVRYDGKRLPFASGSFDAALLVDVLHHAHDPGATLGEAVRVSRGTVVIKDHVRVSRWSACVLAAMDWFGNRPYDVPLGNRYLSWPEWERVFVGLQLRITKVTIGIDLYPWPFSLLFRSGWQFVVRLAAVGGEIESRR